VPSLASVQTTAVRIRTDTSFIDGDLTVPQDAVALVIFAHGSGSSRFTSRKRSVAETLQRGGCADSASTRRSVRTRRGLAEDTFKTRRAFEQLPMLLLAAMRSPCSGVMIARGDLAVECGYERLAEVQEQILWTAEASHSPVIRATPGLEGLAKAGRFLDARR
jgi:hypothetical protein